MADVLRRNNVRVAGNPAGRPMVFSHGFGCDQHMWRYITPAFEQDYRLVLFDHVGHGGSDLTAYDKDRYDSLQGYADAVLEIAETLELRDAVFVGHSVSSMIGVLAAITAPDVFTDLVLVSPSPRYVNDDGYHGGFDRPDIEELLEALDSNYLGWSSAMAPVIMGRPDRPELGEELTNSFCRTDPDIAKDFARVTFLSDNRGDLAKVPARALVLQCAEDAIAPQEVGRFVAEEIPRSEFVLLDAVGHCPNLSAPEETIDAMRAFLSTS